MAATPLFRSGSKEINATASYFFDTECDIVQRSFIFLKNNCVLLLAACSPLVALIGPLAGVPIDQLETWVLGCCCETDSVTVSQVLEKFFPRGKTLLICARLR